jgi:hypothetical protein
VVNLMLTETDNVRSVWQGKPMKYSRLLWLFFLPLFVFGQRANTTDIKNGNDYMWVHAEKDKKPAASK